MALCSSSPLSPFLGLSLNDPMRMLIAFRVGIGRVIPETIIAYRSLLWRANLVPHKVRRAGQRDVHYVSSVANSI